MIELIDFMMQHFLPSVTLNMIFGPYIDSEINYNRYFIKIQFVNKGIEFINLPSISKIIYLLSLLFLLILKIRNPIVFVISMINIFVVLFLTVTN